MASRRNDYAVRVNRVLDYIESHIDGDLSVSNLSEIACFSPFHFHRVFHALVGEPLGQFIGRIRLEKAASLLIMSKDRPVIDVGVECGYDNPAAFSRAFRQHLGMTPSEWRRMADPTMSDRDSQLRRISTLRSKSGTEQEHVSGYRLDESKPGRYPMSVSSEMVEVKKLDAMTVAYVRHIGPYAGDGALFASLFGKLFSWAGPRGLVNPAATRALAIYHDDPSVTDEDKLRLTCAISVPPDTEVTGEISKMEIPAGTYALARFRLGEKEYQEAWNWVYGEWLPNSGYEPEDRPCFEMYLNDASEDPEGKSELDICIAVKPAS